MKILITFIVVFLLGGCASQIMNSYLGNDVREVMVDYGAPTNAFDMGDGRRAFQWIMEDEYTTPVTATTTGNINTYGSSSWVNSNTIITGGQTINSKCIYTMFGRWNDQHQGWYITDFKKPSLMCE